jgi:hypothetical protein
MDSFLSQPEASKVVANHWNSGVRFARAAENKGAFELLGDACGSKYVLFNAMNSFLHVGEGKRTRKSIFLADVKLGEECTSGKAKDRKFLVDQISLGQTKRVLPAHFGNYPFKISIDYLSAVESTAPVSVSASSLPQGAINSSSSSTASVGVSASSLPSGAINSSSSSTGSVGGSASSLPQGAINSSSSYTASGGLSASTTHLGAIDPSSTGSTAAEDASAINSSSSSTTAAGVSASTLRSGDIDSSSTSSTAAEGASAINSSSSSTAAAGVSATTWWQHETEPSEKEFVEACMQAPAEYMEKVVARWLALRNGKVVTFRSQGAAQHWCRVGAMKSPPKTPAEVESSDNASYRKFQRNLPPFAEVFESCFGSVSTGVNYMTRFLVQMDSNAFHSGAAAAGLTFFEPMTNGETLAAQTILGISENVRVKLASVFRVHNGGRAVMASMAECNKLRVKIKDNMKCELYETDMLCLLSYINFLH